MHLRSPLAFVTPGGALTGLGRIPTSLALVVAGLAGMDAVALDPGDLLLGVPAEDGQPAAILHVDPTTELVTTISEGGLLRDAWAIDIDRERNIIVVEDTSLIAIDRHDRSQSEVPVTGVSDLARDLDATRDGWLHFTAVLPGVGHSLVQFDATSSTLVTIVSDDGLQTKGGLVVDGDRAFVGSTEDELILAVDRLTGGLSVLPASGLPSGLVLEESGDLVVASSGKLVRVDPDTAGTTILLAPQECGFDERCFSYHGLGIDPAGVLFAPVVSTQEVPAFEGYAILRFDPAGDGSHTLLLPGFSRTINSIAVVPARSPYVEPLLLEEASRHVSAAADVTVERVDDDFQEEESSSTATGVFGGSVRSSASVDPYGGAFPIASQYTDWGPARGRRAVFGGYGQAFASFRVHDPSYASTAEATAESLALVSFVLTGPGYFEIDARLVANLASIAGLPGSAQMDVFSFYELSGEIVGVVDEELVSDTQDDAVREEVLFSRSDFIPADRYTLRIESVVAGSGIEDASGSGIAGSSVDFIVPEPAALPLSLASAATIVYLRRRRRFASSPPAVGRKGRESERRLSSSLETSSTSRGSAAHRNSMTGLGG